MARTSRRRRRASRLGSILVIVVLTLLLSGLVGGLGYLFVSASSNRIVLTENLCPDSGATGQTLVLVDTTDPLGPLARTEVLSKLKVLTAGIGVGELLEIRVLQPGVTASKSIFTRCNPGDGGNLSELTANPEAARRRWADGFDQPLMIALQETLSVDKAETSPILEAIQELSVERLSFVSPDGKPTKFVVVSDMLEHGEFFSHYRNGIDYTAFKKLGLSQRFMTNLSNTDVELWIALRDFSQESGQQLAEFWANWLTDNNANDVRVLFLQGIQ